MTIPSDCFSQLEKESGKSRKAWSYRSRWKCLFARCSPSINPALAMTDPEEKNERYKLMMKHV